MKSQTVAAVFAVTKVRNCENAGATAAIVVDNVVESFLPYMADDGTGRNIGIPSVMISKQSILLLSVFFSYSPRTDGQLLKNAVNNSGIVQMSMSWSLPEPDNRVEVQYWTSSSDKDVSQACRSSDFSDRLSTTVG